MQPIIAPSILSADFARLGEAVSLIDRSKAGFVHIDVMDGRFVPNISFGLPVIKAIRSYTKKTFDVHLMILEPERYAAEFRDAGADILTVHIEASVHLHRTLQVIHSLGMKTGVALNPHTPVSSLDDVIEDIDLVCLMSVNPGFGGQKYIPYTLEKVRQLRALCNKRNPNCLIEIDGGITLDNAAENLRAGANVLVAGNTVFGSPDPEATIEKLLFSDSVSV
jgi:ribulose-phosphate 3-epimerase